MRRAPFHSQSHGDGVYHDNDECPDARAVKAIYRAEGTGGRPLCRTCARLSAGQAAGSGPKGVIRPSRWD